MLILFCTELYISLDQPSCMLENLIVYSTVGFSICYIALEIVWHFGACRIHNKRIQPCMFKKVKTIPVQNTICDKKRRKICHDEQYKKKRRENKISQNRKVT